MLYYLIKLPLRLVCKIFFRKIYFTNKERIPTDVPIIFAVNHPTAFIDPIMVASLIGPSTHFMLRGDVFSSPVVRFFLDQIKTIPIFRGRDGFSKLRNNQDTFTNVYQKINEGKNILILAEGQTKHEKKMRPIQKGAARMLFGTFEKYGRKDMVVIPVGVNFTDSHTFRSKVMIDFGEPIALKDYIPSYEAEPRQAIMAMTQKISDGMQARIIHVEQNEREAVASQLMEIHRNNKFEKMLPVMVDDFAPLKAELKIADQVNQMNSSTFSGIENHAEEYKGLLNALALKDIVIAQPQKSNWKNTVILIIGLIPFLLGYALNALPLLLAKIIADRKAKKIEFHSSVRFAAGFLLYSFYFIILAIVLYNLNWKWWMIIATPLLGWFAIYWRDLFSEWNAARTFQALPASTQEEIKELRNNLNSAISI